MQVTRDRTERPHGALLRFDIECLYHMYRMVGAVEVGTLVSTEALVGYYPCVMTTLTRTTNRGGRQCQMGSLTGAVAS